MSSISMRLPVRLGARTGGLSTTGSGLGPARCRFSRSSLLAASSMRCQSGFLRSYNSVTFPAWKSRTRVPRISISGAAAASVGRRTIFIQTEGTPNADALKFKPNCRVLPEKFGSPFIEYLTPRSTVAPPYPSQLAASLMSVDGVDSVFFGTDYITVIKNPATAWQHIKPEVFSLITEYVTAGKDMVTVSPTSGAGAAAAVDGEDAGGGAEAADSLALHEDDDEVVGMIKELLETRIRPTIQEDGGDIDFRGFENGVVYLKLRGACRTCDSSTVTLKRGIESMLMHYIEEVEAVEQVMDPEEEVAIKEFARFEARLRAQSGAGVGAGGTAE